MSLDPPLVLVCIDHRSEANRGLRESGVFAVSVLEETQEAVSRRFAAPGTGKLEGFDFVKGELGLPLVPGAVAHVECEVRSFHEEGDHAVWVGQVRAASTSPGRPLLHHAGAYRTLRGRRGCWQARRRSVITACRKNTTNPNKYPQISEEGAEGSPRLRAPWPRTC